MKTIFLSFVGANDAGRLEEMPPGAIRTIFEEREFDEVRLLYNDGKTPKGTPYGRIAKELAETLGSTGGKIRTKVTTQQIDFLDIADHVEVYQKLMDVLKKTYPERTWSEVEFTAGISSGTPAMQIAWVLLAESGDFPLNLVRSVRPEHSKGGKRVIDIPLGTGILPKIQRLKVYDHAFGGLESSDYSIVIDPTRLTPGQQAIAEREEHVLIIGETGVGKEVLARTIHTAGRTKGAFVTINCGSVPETLIESELFGHKKGAFTGAFQDKKGLVEEADQGTLFLDEVNSMPIQLQAKFLRFLDSGEFRKLGETKDRRVKVRIIAAGNQPLARLVHKSAFREDLYYRLCAFEFFIPPLRDRKKVLVALAEGFLAESSVNSVRFSQDGLDALTKHDFRGNVRELRTAISRLLVLNPGKKTLDRDDVTRVVSRMVPSVERDVEIPEVLYGRTLELVEDILFQAAIRKANGVDAKAGKILGVSAPTVAKRRKTLGTR